MLDPRTGKLKEDGLITIVNQLMIYLNRHYRGNSDLPIFINLLNDIVIGEVVERCRTIRSMGDYELVSM